MGQSFQVDQTPVAQVASVSPELALPPLNFGSNQARQDTLGLAAPPAALTPQLTPPTVDAAPPERLPVYRNLGQGKTGDDVKALQRFLGIEGDAVDGDYGKGTAGKVRDWQASNGLDATGTVGPRTVAAMRGDEYIYGYNLHQDPGKFVPKYPMTAYHESGDYRNANDPYAVGAITHPTKEQDTGGKTYGTYQFESYRYPDGTSDKKSAPGSTLQRFLDWKDNPYSKQFQEAIAKSGVAGADFDKLWGDLTAKDNKAFGSAQQSFLEVDVADKVKALMDTAGASDAVRKDPRVMDLMMGTVNQYGGLANGHIAAAADAQKAAGHPLSADELALAIQDHKAANVEGNFSKSPDAWDGIRQRIADEREVFAPKKK